MTTDDVSRYLSTRAGFRFLVRPARPDDEAGLADFFTHVTPEDLRFRFLTTVREVGHDRLANMTKIQDGQTENFIAFTDDGKTIIAAGMLACDAALEKGEVAISIRREYKHRGVGWELLRHICEFAEGKGLKSVESLEDRQNHEAIEIEREQGFEIDECPDDVRLVVLRKSLRQTRL
ncbi:MAG: GNAT family N-acetyltransferase [Bosea sp.]|uniref:GNAT family N-acetyltransferase n=1 Tax=Bosea sp. (in: a-proteobacteria) TaxID=1871050 RepID=UPI001ACBA7B9|nr:GNAT family N-acetyltransferase [Bosea sp. (in: a-proteobacteria)]MBN9453353.1 GNAT family N-acetyltransferase [Bosea sp. (in: a-proteobacteria)]